jgi:hypothetical protein
MLPRQDSPNADACSRRVDYCGQPALAGIRRWRISDMNRAGERVATATLGLFAYRNENGSHSYINDWRCQVRPSRRFDKPIRVRTDRAWCAYVGVAAREQKCPTADEACLPRDASSQAFFDVHPTPEGTLEDVESAMKLVRTPSGGSPLRAPDGRAPGSPSRVAKAMTRRASCCAGWMGRIAAWVTEPRDPTPRSPPPCRCDIRVGRCEVVGLPDCRQRDRGQKVTSMPA